MKSRYVAKVDVFAFYETVDHDILAETLTSAVRSSEAVDLIIDFLSRTMDRRSGLPQGLLPSDALASIYLDQLDRSMVKEGWKYFRRGDDIRIAVDSFSAGRRAIADTESYLRDLGLILNEAKTFVMKRSTYEANLRDVSEAEAELRTAMTREVEEDALELESLGELHQFLVDRGALPEEETEELLWDVYHESITIEELIEMIRPSLTPPDYAVAARLFSETLRKAPESSDSLPLEAFNRRLTSALAVLAIAQNPIALPQVDRMLFRYPWLTEVISNYLTALAKTKRKRIVTVLEAFLLKRRFRHDWQEAWLLSVLIPYSKSFSPDFVDYLQGTVSGSLAKNPLTKAYAARALARRGDLDQDSFDSLWRTSHPAIKPDLLDAAKILLESEDWPRRYLQDPDLSNSIRDLILARP